MPSNIQQIFNATDPSPGHEDSCFFIISALWRDQRGLYERFVENIWKIRRRRKIYSHNLLISIKISATLHFKNSSKNYNDNPNWKIVGKREGEKSKLYLILTFNSRYSGACPPLAGPYKFHWSIQSPAPNFFRNAFFILVLYRKTKNWFKKLGTRKKIKKCSR